jgi:hypothetical protein
MKLKDLQKDKLFQTAAEVLEWIDHNGIQNAIVNRDLSIDVDGDVDIWRSLNSVLPVRFSRITGLLNLSSKFKSLKGLPPDTIGGLNCIGSGITSLEGCSRVVKNSFSVSYCESLKSLKGGPRIVNGSYGAKDVKLDSLEGIAEEIQGSLLLTLTNPNIKLLDILKIKRLKAFDLDATNVNLMPTSTQLSKIFTKWLKEPYGNKRIIGCQSALIDAGLESFAEFGEDQ